MKTCSFSPFKVDLTSGSATTQPEQISAPINSLLGYPWKAHLTHGAQAGDSVVLDVAEWLCVFAVVRPKDYERAVVVDAEVKKEQGRPLFGVKREVRSTKI